MSESRKTKTITGAKVYASKLQKEIEAVEEVGGIEEMQKREGREKERERRMEEVTTTTKLKELFYLLFPGVENMRNLLSVTPVTNVIHKSYKFNVTHGVVSPNTDTLYGVAVCDLTSDTDMYIKIPETTRYYSLQFVDVWCHNFAYLFHTSEPGIYKLEYNPEPDPDNHIGNNLSDDDGTNVGSGNRYIGDKITGNSVNKSIKPIVGSIIKSPSKLCLILCRVYANYYDEHDIKLAGDVLRDIIVSGKPTKNPIPKTEVNPKLTPLDVSYFLQRAKLLNSFQTIVPPESLDELIASDELVSLCYIPFTQGQSNIETTLLTPSPYIPHVNVSTSSTSSTSSTIITKITKTGWKPISANSVDSNFEFAIVQWQGLYANNYQTSLYYFNNYDQNGNRYNGEHHSYYMILNKLPPAGSGAFWSINCYDINGHIAQNTNRVVVGTSSNIVKNKNDNKYTLYFLPVNSPLNNIYPKSNILTIPSSPCNFIMRVYSPTNYQYVPPIIRYFTK